ACVGFFPVKARKSTSAMFQQLNRSSREIPHRLPCWWCLAGIEAPIITPYRRRYQGSVSAVRREIRFRINGPQAVVGDIAARMASRDGRSQSDSTNFKNSDLPPRSPTGF